MATEEKTTAEKQGADERQSEKKQGSDELKSTEEQRNAEPETDEHHQVVDAPDPPPPTEKPEVTDEHKEKAKEMRKDYEEDRPTISMPGTDGAVSGTAVNDWVDDDGNPRFNDESEKDESKKDSKDESKKDSKDESKDESKKDDA